jgi:hypothetical protein
VTELPRGAVTFLFTDIEGSAWLALYNAYGADLISKRVGNYQYNPLWGVLLAQLWVK